MTILHWIGDLVRSALGQVPLSLVRGLFVAVPVVLLVWVLMLPTSATTPGDGRAGWSENLKTWAAIALLLQIAIYVLF